MLVGVGGFGASFLLFNMVIVQVDAWRTAVVLNLIPVFGVVSAVVFLREGMTSRDAIGAVLVGSSVLYFAIADRRDAAAQAIRAEPDSARSAGTAAQSQGQPGGPAAGSGTASSRDSAREALPFRRYRYPEPDGLGCGGLPGWGAEFGQHGRDVMIDGLGRDEQLLGDLGVAVPDHDQVENLVLPLGQAERMCPRRGARPGRD